MQTTETPQIGMILTSDEVAFGRTVANVNKHLQKPLDALHQGYNSLGLSRPFSQKLFEEILQDGLHSIVSDFEAMTKKDLEGFRSPVVVSQMLTHVDVYIKPLRDAVTEIRKGLDKSFNETGFQFSMNDISFAEGQFLINTEGAREFYTKRITTEKQLLAYKKLQELSAVHNEAVRLVETSGINMSGNITASWMQIFFKTIPSGANSYSREIEVKLDVIPFIR